MVNHGVPVSKDIAHVSVGIRVQIDAVGEDALLVKFFDRLPRVFNQQTRIMCIHVRGLPISQNQHQLFVSLLSS